MKKTLDEVVESVRDNNNVLHYRRMLDTAIKSLARATSSRDYHQYNGNQADFIVWSERCESWNNDIVQILNNLITSVASDAALEARLSMHGTHSQATK